jgi:hypothetical protein
VAEVHRLIGGDRVEVKLQDHYKPVVEPLKEEGGQT